MFVFNLMFTPTCLLAPEIFYLGPSNAVVEGGSGVLYCCVSIPLALECLPAFRVAGRSRGWFGGSYCRFYPNSACLLAPEIFYLGPPTQASLGLTVEGLAPNSSFVRTSVGGPEIVHSVHTVHIVHLFCNNPNKILALLSTD